MGHYCGKLLADLGADVIKVEPPGGEPSRARAPFWNGEPGRETSLRFWYFNANKRSVTVDLGQFDGRWLFGQLVKTADIVIEAWTAAERSELAEHGVDPDAYMEAQPALIWVSITGFGLDGPKSGWQVTDLIAQAASGIATLAGYPDGSPMRIAGNQAYIVAGISAAQGALARAVAGRSDRSWTARGDVDAGGAVNLPGDGAFAVGLPGHVAPADR